MLLSSRHHPPPLTLQSTISNNNLARPRALQSTSPLPSPGLPSILPRHGRKPPRLNSRRILHWLAYLVACLTVFWVAGWVVSIDQGLPSISYTSVSGQAYQVVGDGLPREPSPIVVTNQRGRSRWTVSIPPELEFPLKPEQYASICKKSMDLSHHMAEEKSTAHKHTHAAHHPYYYIDPLFMDVVDAESHDILPGIPSGKVELEADHMSSSDLPRRQCDRSLTYALESSTFGLGESLLSLWLAYGLAQSEKRAFFIDDTRWPYGSYSTYFQPPPSPDCRPPPKTQIVPCPHQAKHLLVSAATTRHAFGHGFANEFEDPKKVGVLRQHKIFAMMRLGYKALFQGKLNDQDQTWLNGRLAELNSTVRDMGGEEVGVHVRRGDCHPLEYQYQKSYIPLEKYLDEAHNLTTTSNSLTLLASDDPDIYNSSRFPAADNIEKAQSAISLASKSSLAASGQSGLGWEGGYFKDVFWSLGRPDRRKIGSGQNPEPAEPTTGDPPSSDPHKEPTGHALTLRQLVGRAYLLDLAVLGQTDQIVCAVSAYGCRILAVMMGWDDAIVQQRWLNLDGSFHWRGVEW